MRHLFSALFIFVAVSGCKPDQPTSAIPVATSKAVAIDVVELDAASIQHKLESGAFTSRQLTQAYLDRIAQMDKAGPSLNSIIEINTRALAEADELDMERKAGKIRGPLHGIPILLKDNIDTVGMINSAGSLAMADNHP